MCAGWGARSARVIEKPERRGTSKTGQNPPGWRGTERGWVLVSQYRASSILNEVTDCDMWWD